MTAPTLDPVAFAGPGLVTVAYVALYYAFMVGVLRAKLRLERAYKDRGEAFDRYFGQDREMLAADRIQLNTLEHMGPFLVLLWMNALFVSPTEATWLGGLYVASRAVYPLLMGSRIGRSFPPRVMASTMVAYLVVAILGVRCAQAFLGG